ncbi:MAG: AAA family ATPase [Gordonia polyisoprenivorans]|nr:AAA family ATPase [Gordonia polyisoprenivorans]
MTITDIGGQCLIHSHSDPTETVLEALGLTMKDLFDRFHGVEYQYPGGRRVRRGPGKKFSQSGDRADRSLYMGPDVDSLPDGDAVVYVVEGEKDVHTLRAHGHVAVSSAQGAGKAHLADWSPLTGRDVVVVADKDEPGRRHARQVAERLDGSARTVTVVEARTGKDATDHVMAGHDIGDLVTITAPTASTGRALEVTRASDVTMRRIDWWLPGLIPKASLTLLAGREGLGKSTIAVDWCAQETRAGGTVIYLHTEDSREHTVTPRLAAADADLDRVLFVDVETEETSEGSLILPVDIEALEEKVVEHEVTLIVLDAATSAMAANLSGRDDREVRKFLEPLSRLASKRNLVVLGLVHFGKREGADTGKLILGSIAWSQVARSVLSLARDENDDSLVLTATKSNLAASTTRSHSLRLVSTTVETPDGPAELGRVEWLGETDRDARELLSGDSDDESPATVADIIRNYLTECGGTAAAGEVFKHTRAAGLLDATVKKARAKKSSGIRTERRGFGPGASWVWTIDAPPIGSPIGAIGTHTPSEGTFGTYGEPTQPNCDHCRGHMTAAEDIELGHHLSCAEPISA